MKFPSLKIENFLAITEAEINLADRGLVLIQGVNTLDTSAVSNGAGKCLSGNTLLADADTGEQLTIAKWHNEFIKGRRFRVHGLSDDYKLSPVDVSDVFKTGRKQMVQVNLANGSSENVSITHPILTQRGCVNAANLRTTDYIAAPREKLKALAKSGIIWVKLDSLVSIPDEETYDISVDSDNHLYALNSFITHNSSIADALCWCWYGVTARGETGDGVINDDAGKGCRVTSQLQDGPLVYTATRHRKHKTGKNTLTLTMHDGLKETILTKGTDKLTQEVATQIIGASLDVFVGSIYAGQEKMPDLPAMTDKQLKVLVEEGSGVLVLEEAYRRALEIARETEAAYDLKRAEIEARQSNFDWHTNEILTERVAEADWEDVRKVRTDDLKNTVSVEVVPLLKDAMAKVAKIVVGDIEAKIASCDKEIAGVAGEQSQKSTLEAAVSNATRDVALVKSNIGDDTANLQRSNKKLEHIADEIGKPCGECARPITAAELEAKTKNTEDSIKAAEQALQGNEAALKTRTGALTEATDALALHLASMTDVSATIAQRALYAQQQADERSTVASRDQLTVKARDFKERILAVLAEVNPRTATIERHEATQAKVQVDIDALKTIVAKMEKSVLVDRDVAKVFGPSGVRARILDQVTPFLNAQTAKYLDVLTDGNMVATWSTLVPGSKKGTLKEKFSIDVVNAVGGKTFKSISGGEKRKVRVATALALQDLVATRATKPIDLFIGDEIDDALDVAGVERLMTVLEDKANERGSVFIISHNEIQDFVSNIIEIEKTYAGTVIREASS